MKGKNFLILINNAFRMAGYHIALGNELKQNGANVIYVFTDRMPFYTDEIDLDPSEYYVFSDYFEKEYNRAKELDKSINFNKTFFSEYDRSIVFGDMKFEGNDYYQRLIANLSSFFEEIYTKYNIDFCIYETISNSFAYIAYEVGLKHNVQYCGYAGSRLKGRFELYTEEFGSANYFKKVFCNLSFDSLDRIEQAEITAYIKSFSESSIIPTYHPKNTVLDWDFSFYKRYFNKEKILLFRNSLLYLFKFSNRLKYGYQTGNPVYEQIKSVKKQINKLFIVRFSQKYFDKPNSQESYFLYPQHFKPEASTSVLAKHYCNDISVIENIASNLPFGSFLYVKEHFVNFGRLPTSYYKRLKDIPNVKLISCDQNTKELIINSKGVITLTSTVGYEALLYNKPVFVFGNVFYECHPNCRKLYGFDNLFEELNNLDVDVDESINKTFIAAYRSITYPGNIYYHIASDDYSKADFTKPIVKAINERFFS